MILVSVHSPPSCTIATIARLKNDDFCMKISFTLDDEVDSLASKRLVYFLVNRSSDLDNWMYFYLNAVKVVSSKGMSSSVLSVEELSDRCIHAIKG